MKVAAGAFLFLCLLLSSSLVKTSAAAELNDKGPATDLSPFCKGKCEVRCSSAGRKERCMEYCGICCSKCNCVPSGTVGNKDECPCYRDLKNSKGKPKCP
ncbi:Gibberellin-regulated family protein [Perilla frutescens var. hirtella]|uniref:Gibberellin-regulated family protein n=1 Tax=Perilla frutescens var. hirtella TaxID=608512 RepID=A0AAD4JGE8_PERFH|nr:Gibberellin-regulated family protein [Perilla frutescens var. hirtella]